jgi:hypothetical protein
VKTLTTQADLARQRRWQEVIYLLELTLYRDRFSPAAQTFRLWLSDAPRVELGQEWVPLVENWGDVGDALNAIDTSGTVATLDLTLRNHVRVGGAARFSDLVRHGNNSAGYDLASGNATLKLLFRGGAADDAVKVFDFRLEELAEITDESCRLHMSGRELAIEDRDGMLRITTDRFPYASPTAIGQPIPYVFGVVKQMPVLWAVAGLVDKLRQDMTPQFPTDGGVLYGSSPDIVGRLPSAGRLQIDGEQIQYGGKDTGNAAFTGIVRGVNGSQKAAHSVGASIVQVLSKFIAICWENRPDYAGSAITGVYFKDGTFKDPNLVPRHVIKLSDLETWPGKDLCTVHFEGVDAVS